MEVQLIGIDCATQDTKIGLALGILADGHLSIGRAFVHEKNLLP